MPATRDLEQPLAIQTCSNGFGPAIAGMADI
jgi:hypothetical protein